MLEVEKVRPRKTIPPSTISNLESGWTGEGEAWMRPTAGRFRIRASYTTSAKVWT